MPAVVERSFEPASDVVARAVPDFRHCLGCSPTPASRPANKEEFVIEAHTERLEVTGQALREARVDRLIGKCLPLDEERPFAHRPEVRKSHIGPLCAGSYIDELGPRIGLEGLPDRLPVAIVNSLLVVL